MAKVIDSRAKRSTEMLPEQPDDSVEDKHDGNEPPFHPPGTADQNGVPYATE